MWPFERIGPTMRVVYSDESGLGGGEGEPVVVVTAICIDVDRQWHEIERAMTEAIFAVLSRKLLVGGSELKGQKLYQCLRKNRPGAAETLTRVLSVVSGNKVPIFYS